MSNKEFVCDQRIDDKSDLLQNVIYFMNNNHIRHQVMKKTLKTNRTCEYLGTWSVMYEPGSALKLRPSFDDPFFNHESLSRQSLDEFVLSRRARFLTRSKPCKLFSVCIIYEGNKVHYVSFVYDNVFKKMYSFDSGIQLYTHGLDTLIPAVQRAFLLAGLIRSGKNNLLGKCHSYKLKGIQYNGGDGSFPADSFCQSWSLFFLVQYSIVGNYKFITSWCNVRPMYRERYIITCFLLPTFKQNKQFAKQMSMHNLDYNTVMHAFEKESRRCLYKPIA